MAPKNVRMARRQPLQARSRDTVGVILAASVQVLTTGGYAALTIRAVAQRAGVSVGSIYQYFDSKEALVRALADAQRAEMIAAVTAAMERTGERTLTERLPALLEALLAAKASNPALDAKLSSAMLEIDGPCFLTENTEPFRRLTQRALTEHAAELDLEDAELTSFVIVRALEGVLSAAAASGQRSSDPRLVEMLKRLVMGLVVGRRDA